MTTEWRTTALNDVLAEVLDRRGVTPLKLGSDFTRQGHRVISAKLVKNGRIDLTADESRFVDGETYARWMKGPLRPDDVIMTSEAPLGEVAYVAETFHWCLGQRLFGLRTRKNRMHGRFLYYALLSNDVLQGLRARATGTTALGIRQSELLKVLVPEPPPEHQSAIAHILGTLDDKIELNRRMNETLEAIARAIFKSWFVELYPALVKAATFVEQGALDIGDGYRAKNSELGLTGLPFIRAGDLNDGINADTSDRLLEQSLAAAQKKRSRPGDVVFTSKGTIGRLARVSEYDAEVVYSPQVCFWRSLDSEAIHPAILYCWMRSDDFHRQVAAVAGQTDMAPYVSLRDQRSMLMPVFPEDQFVVGEQISPLLSQIAANRAEAKTLADVRDTLLPKLLSGELRVPLAEAA